MRDPERGALTSPSGHARCCCSPTARRTPRSPPPAGGVRPRSQSGKPASKRTASSVCGVGTRDRNRASGRPRWRRGSSTGRETAAPWRHALARSANTQRAPYAGRPGLATRWAAAASVRAVRALDRPRVRRESGVETHYVVLAKSGSVGGQKSFRIPRSPSTAIKRRS